MNRINISFELEDLPLPEELFLLANESYHTGSPWSVSGFEQDIKTDHARYGIVSHNEECIGFVGYHQVLNEAEITNFVVKKNFQHQGIATYLLQTCLKILVAEGIEKVFLEVRESNQPAIHLYEKNGFIQIGIRKNYYSHPKEHALLLQLTLEN